mgnify:CR=1 FL=1
MARYQHSSDQKGRIFIPAKLREEIGSAVYVTRALDKGFLACYTEERFADIRRQIDELPGTDPMARRLRRAIIGEASRCQLDSQGRISINDELWSTIGVRPGETVYLIDMGESLEICGKTFFDEMEAGQTPITDLDLSEYHVTGIL